MFKAITVCLLLLLAPLAALAEAAPDPGGAIEVVSVIAQPNTARSGAVDTAERQRLEGLSSFAVGMALCGLVLGGLGVVASLFLASRPAAYALRPIARFPKAETGSIWRAEAARKEANAPATAREQRVQVGGKSLARRPGQDELSGSAIPRRLQGAFPLATPTRDG